MIEKQKSGVSRLEFQDLMLYRVYEILLVASPYDAFILEEDGRLTEQILHEYLGMNLNYPPRVWHAESGNEALELIVKRKFDLVIVMMRIGDMDPVTFARQIKQRFPNKPVILLVFDESEIKQLPEVTPENPIDKIFIWAGNASVFPAIIKYIEDKKNANRDILKGDVRAIIFIEDNPRIYSVILPLIYKEILYHVKQLVRKSLTDTFRLLHLRGRPKILLVSNYEEAGKYFKRYRTNVLGIISDIRFPRHGVSDPKAGIKFSKFVRKLEPSMPIMLQSSEREHAIQAKRMNAHFLFKKSGTLLQDIRDFMIANFGFGDFIFRNQDGQEFGQATNLITLQKAIEKVPDESLVYHASSNHFSNWLAARSEFDLASAIRPLQLKDFTDVAELRAFLIQAIGKALEIKKKGHVVEFFHESYSQTTNFTRLTLGSLGGKARGLAFANTLLASSNVRKKFPGINIRIPRSAVIGTDEFDRFMDDNKLWDFALSKTTDTKISKRFLRAHLSDELKHNLRTFIKQVQYPLAIRSSCLMEDSQYQPLAGVYATYMLPNSHSKDEIRLKQLCEAIKLVYASTYHQEAKSIFNATVLRHEEEKMAVIIMELSGQKYNNRFYPTISGSAQSINYYPVSYMLREDGIVTAALGFGRTVVEGEKALRFSPKYPAIIAQFDSIKSTINNSQSSFYALDLNPKVKRLKPSEKDNLQAYDLSVAESDGSLSWVASVVSPDDNIIRDSLSYPGIRVITFVPILKWNLFPLPAIISEILKIGKKALGSPVEIEFAVNLFKDKPIQPEFCLLQIRPTVVSSSQSEYDTSSLGEENIFIQSSNALGNGSIEGIKDIILVDLEKFDSSKSVQIAQEIEDFNRQLFPDKPYLLIGSGRWGSADPWLGIPVNWQQISGAQVIVEVGLPKSSIDPSFGSHFFQNVTSLRIGYFTINHKNKRDKIAIDWLNEQRLKEEKKHTRWIALDNPILVHIDGQTGAGFISKPIEPVKAEMDEQESSGI